MLRSFRRPSLWGLLVVLALAWAASGSIPSAVAQPSLVITKEFQTVAQGTAGVIRISGPDLAGAQAVVFDRTFQFFPVQDGLAALISVDLSQRIREYPLKVTLQLTSGGSLDWEDTLRVSSGGFIAEPQFILPRDRQFLLSPDIQANEDLRLKTIFSKVTPERFWDGPFSQPLVGRLGSPFGSVRSYEDGQTRRHTGVDFSAVTGTPVLASSNGRVVFARALDIHGNHVVVDHGLGVFTGYSHLSTLYVVPGQFVLQGDVLGLSGNTGRSTGPHLHWEVAVNGVWVDPVRFQDLKLPN